MRSTFKERKTADVLVWLGLPLLLFGLTYGLIGFYYETNDDQIITLLLRGISSRPAQEDLAIYFFGFSQLMTWLYAVLPQVPWYGLILYSGLLLATGLAFRLLLQAFPLLVAWQRWALLAGFYVFCWLEHVMWFNYMRVPLLLAGTSFLWLLCHQQQPAFRWAPWLLSGLLFVVAFCIRPSAASLGLLVVGPAGLLLFGHRHGWRYALMPFFFVLALALAFLLWRQARQTPQIRQYQTLDLWKSAILDYGIYQARLNSRADSLAFAAINNWFLADQQVLHTGFYQQHGSISLAYVLQQAPRKGKELLQALVRDQFLLLWLNACLLAWLWYGRPSLRLRLMAYECCFWLLLLAIGLGLKLPPRVLTPCLSLYTLVHLLLLPGSARPAWQQKYRLVLLVSGLIALTYLAKVSHRAGWQRQQQQTHEQFIAELARTSQGQTLVYSALPAYFRSLSPLRNYQFGGRLLFPLTGWSTLDPAYSRFYRRQTGQDSFVAALLVLSRQKNACWLLEPGFYLFLNQYLQTFHNSRLQLLPQASPLERYGVSVYVGYDKKAVKKENIKGL